MPILLYTPFTLTPGPDHVGLFMTVCAAGAPPKALVAGAVIESMRGDNNPFPSALIRMPSPSAGTIERAYFHMSVNTLDGATPVTLLVNGAPTPLTVTFAPGATGTQSATGSVAIVAGDVVSYLFDASASGAGQGFGSANADMKL
jgi:hypothetical protein